MEVRIEMKKEEGKEIKEGNINQEIMKKESAKMEVVKTNDTKVVTQSSPKTEQNHSIIDNDESVNSIIETCKKCVVKNFQLSTSKEFDVHVGVGANYKGITGTIGVKVRKMGGIEFKFNLDEKEE